MSNLSKNDLLLKILKADTASLRDFIQKKATLSSEDSWVILPKGESKGRICIVTHIDTFFDTENTKYKPDAKDIFIDERRGVIWSPQGLGADDRAGIFAAFKIYKDMPEHLKPILLFCDGEESGGCGAKSVYKNFGEILQDCNYFIELDRANFKRCVFYNEEPREFRDYVKSFGFERGIGTFTDISFIVPYFERCGVNLSIGYYLNHSRAEYLRYGDLCYTIKRVKRMLSDNYSLNRTWYNDKRVSLLDWKNYSTDYGYYNYEKKVKSEKDDATVYYLCMYCSFALTEEEAGSGKCVNCDASFDIGDLADPFYYRDY